MNLENEVVELKEKLEDLKEKRSSLKTEISIKQKSLDETKADLKKRLDAQGVTYKDLDSIILKLEKDLEKEVSEIKSKLKGLESDE